MGSDDLQQFVNGLDSLLDDALTAGVAADDLEMILQKRAQDMREVHFTQNDK